MNVVLAWLKSNVYTVIFLVVMIAAAVAMPFVGKSLNGGVRAEAESRAQRYAEMTKLEKTTVPLPDGTSESVLINEKFLDEYRIAVEAANKDADAVYARAIEYNRKGRGVLLPALFPKPAAHQAAFLPENFYDALMVAYDALLEDLSAGSPPDPDELKARLHRQQQQLLTNYLAKTSIDQLEPAQLEDLRERLSTARTDAYSQRAQSLKLYADLDALGLPEWDPSYRDQLDELFEMQWTYWIHEDLLWGLAEANASSDSLVNAPVKHLVKAIVEGRAAAAADTGGGGTGGAGFGPGGGGRGGRGGKPAAAATGGTPLNPKVPVPTDFNVSITGRRTNPLYDVRYVNVELIVDPNRVPKILDALARRNFITAVDLHLKPWDPYAGLDSGYFYCRECGLAFLELRLETIWLRPWTREFMPDETRQALGVAPDMPKPDGDETS